MELLALWGFGAMAMFYIVSTLKLTSWKQVVLTLLWPLLLLFVAGYVGYRLVKAEIKLIRGKE